jgi:hypothetical protein
MSQQKLCKLSLIARDMEKIQVMEHLVIKTWQGCRIAMPDLSDSYIEPVGQVDFPG